MSFSFARSSFALDENNNNEYVTFAKKGVLSEEKWKGFRFRLSGVKKIWASIHCLLTLIATLMSRLHNLCRANPYLGSCSYSWLQVLLAVIVVLIWVLWRTVFSLPSFMFSNWIIDSAHLAHSMWFVVRYGSFLSIEYDLQLKKSSAWIRSVNCYSSSFLRFSYYLGTMISQLLRMKLINRVIMLCISWCFYFALSCRYY